MTKIKISRLVSRNEVHGILTWLESVDHLWKSVTMEEVWFTHEADAITFRLKFGI